MTLASLIVTGVRVLVLDLYPRTCHSPVRVGDGRDMSSRIRRRAGLSAESFLNPAVGSSFV